MPYATIQPPFTLKLREMPKKELHRYYQWFMDVLPQRVNELAEAVRQTPGFETWRADCTSGSLDGLGEWFAGQVEVRNAHPRGVSNNPESAGLSDGHSKRGVD